jgi:hypothetical protein
MKASRAFLATVMAPFGGLLGVTVLALIIAASTRDADFILTAWLVPVLGIGYALAIGLPLAIVVGTPLHMLLMHLKLRGLAAYFLAGLIVGAFAAAVLASLQLPTLLAGYAVAGATSMTTFWLVRRPDHDKPNPVTPPT